MDGIKCFTSSDPKYAVGGWEAVELAGAERHVSFITSAIGPSIGPTVEPKNIKTGKAIVKLSKRGIKNIGIQKRQNDRKIINYFTSSDPHHLRD